MSNIGNFVFISVIIICAIVAATVATLLNFSTASLAFVILVGFISAPLGLLLEGLVEKTNKKHQNIINKSLGEDGE